MGNLEGGTTIGGNLAIHTGNLAEAISVGSLNSGLTTGAANVYALALVPAPKAYHDFMPITICINILNTGTSTININGLGAKTLCDSSGTALAAGKLKAGGVYSFRYKASTGTFLQQGERGDYGTATAAQVLSGYTLGTDNGVISGSMPDKSVYGQAAVWTNTDSDPSVELKIPTAGYYDTVAWLQITDTDLIPANIKSGANIFNVAGGYVAKQYASGTLANMAFNTYQEYHGLTFAPMYVIVHATDSASAVWYAAAINIGNSAGLTPKTQPNSGRFYFYEFYSNGFRLWASGDALTAIKWIAWA